MTATATPSASAAFKTPKQQFLEAYEREHATTMRVLRAYPPEKVDLKPHPKCKTARELAWIFVVERGLGKAGLANAFASGAGGSSVPPAPEKWDDLLAALEAAHVDFRKAIESYSDDQLLEPIKFFGAPRTLVDYPRIDFAWFLLMDQIHHRGQMSVYLRMADAKVPSIYGPSADEPWM
jgi:uncharacterized damage-inducible protein DinB